MGPISFYGKNLHPQDTSWGLFESTHRPSRCPATKRRPSCCCWESYDVTSFCWNEPLRHTEHPTGNRSGKDSPKNGDATTWVVFCVFFFWGFGEYTIPDGILYIVMGGDDLKVNCNKDPCVTSARQVDFMKGKQWWGFVPPHATLPRLSKLHYKPPCVETPKKNRVLRPLRRPQNGEVPKTSSCFSWKNPLWFFVGDYTPWALNNPWKNKG